MKLFCHSEEVFRQSLWYRALVSGLSEEARRKRYELAFVDENELLDSSDDLFGDEKRFLIVVATSPSKLSVLLPELSRRGIDVLLVNIGHEGGEGVSTLMMDYEDATERALSYLAACGRRFPALVGVNPDSGSDMVKYRCFERMIGAEGTVFFNYNGIAPLCGRFEAEREHFDAVICANDITGVALLGRLRQKKVRVPDELFMLSFGDTSSAAFLTSAPGVTTVSADHAELGRQAVRLSSFLIRSNVRMTGGLKLAAQLHVGRTTANLPAPEFIPCELSRPAPEPSIKASAPNFYDDPVVGEVMKVEALASTLDGADRTILRILSEGGSIQTAADASFLSASTVTYRIRRIGGALGTRTRAETLDLLERYLPLADLGG